MLSNSKLGFGLMRLPKDKQDQIKLDEVQRMVDSYMERGFNYFDTAYVYEGSEEAIRQTLVEKYPRDVYTLADKLPAWKLTCQEDVERIFQESLNRTGVDYFDFYLLHSVEKSHYPTYEKYQCFDFIQEMKKQGKIKYMGFSFHDDADFLDKVLTEHPEIDFVTIINVEDCTVSYRTIKYDIDLGKDVAALFGGGGHPKAAGSQFDKTVWINIFRDIFMR